MKSSENHGWECPQCKSFHPYHKSPDGKGYLRFFTFEATQRIRNSWW